MYKKLLNNFVMLKSYMHLELIVIALSMISSVIALVSPVLLKLIVDNVLMLNQFFLLKSILLIFVFSFVISIMISYSSTYFLTYIGQNILKKIKMNIFHHMSSIKLMDKHDLNSGDFITKINEDSGVVSNFVTNTFITVITYILNIVAAGALMFLFNKKFAVIITLVTIIQLYCSVKFNNIIKENQRNIRNNYATHISFLNQFFNGYKYIKAYNNEKRYSNNYEELNNKLIKLNIRGFHISFTYGTILGFVSFIGSIIIYGLGIYWISQGRMKLGTLFVFDIIAERFTTYTSAFVELNTELQTVLVSVERIESIMSLDQEEVEEYEDYDSMLLNNIDDIDKISINNVEFQYKDKDTGVLHGVSYDFIRGNSYAIVGDSGCGKTSLMELLVNLYIPDKGNIQFNSIDLRKLKNTVIRDKVSIAFQDPLLNDSTIRENIIFGCETGTEERLEKVAKMCCINDFISSLPNGYDSTVGEVGDKISGGQKQRICLARAFYKNADIYILDEAFSSLDKKLECKIFDNIQKEFSDKIIILVTHNLSLINKLNNIIVMKDGRIEMAGNHEELLSNSKTYRDLYYKGA